MPRGARRGTHLYPISKPKQVERFDLDQITFTPGMAKRPGNGPFDAAPIVQGHADLSGVPDVLSLPRGDLLGNAVGHFYANFDPYQGTILKWFTPEIASATLATGYAYLWYISADYYGRYDYANNRFDYRCGGVTATRTTAIVAGTTYLIVVSWDTKGTIDGTNYIRDGLNDNFAYGGTTLTASAPDAVMELGSDGSASPVNAILEGVFYYRRILYDGAYGTPPVDGTDELTAIYAASVGKDPCQVTGSWDVTLALPTDSQVGALV